MKKLLLVLALSMLTVFPVIALEQFEIHLEQSESKAQSKLYDAELVEVHTLRDGACFRFDALSIFDKEKLHPLHGKICGDVITFD